MKNTLPTSQVLRNLKHRLGYGLLCLLSLVLITATPASAANGIPHFFNYQGRLLSSGGTNVADGSYAIKFSVYTQASGGTPIWTASGTTAVPTSINVDVSSGLFSILLGDTSFQGQNAFDIDWNQDGLYLGVTVGSDSEMTPRKRLSSVPNAFNAEQLQGQYASSSITSAGGSLFAVHQTTADAAAATRTALVVQTDGTSDSNDFLVQGFAGATNVFSISRNGSVTSTGNLDIQGSTTLGSGASDLIALNGHINTDVLPVADLTYSLGSASLRWLGLNVGTVTSTNVIATTVSSTNAVFTNATSSWLGATTVSTTNLYVNGTAITGGAPATTATLQTITDNGDNTTDLIYAYGGVLVGSRLTSTGTADLQTLTYTFATGTSATTTNLFATNGVVTNLTSSFLTATEATATTLAFTSASGSSLTVQGQLVCLADGTNCTASSGGFDLNWTYDASGDFVHNATATTDVVLGAADTSTAGAPIYFDLSGGTTGVSTAYFGYNTDTRVVIGTATSSAAKLTVVGNVQNILETGQSFTTVTTTAAATFPVKFVPKGTFGYLAATNTIQTYDITDPSKPEALGAFTYSSIGTTDIAVTERVAVITAQNAVTIATMDLADPSTPTVLTGIGMTDPRRVAIQGQYAYITLDGDKLNVVDISKPSAPFIASSTTFSGGTIPRGVAADGPELLVTGYGSDSFMILSSDPTDASVLGTLSLGSGAAPTDVAYSGEYAYVVNSGSSTLAVVDIASSTDPVLTATVAVGSTPSRVALSGRYAYITNSGDGTVSVVDLADPTNPVVVSTITVGTSPDGITIQGRYLYVANTGDDTVSVIDISGIETNGLIAHSANLGSLSVLGDADIAQHLYVRNGITSGDRIYAVGSISTGGDLTVVGTASSTNLVVSSAATLSSNTTVGGQSVCLADGTNCGSTTPNWSYNGTTNTLSPVTSTASVRVHSDIDNTMATDTVMRVISTTGLINTPQRAAVDGRYVYVPIDANSGGLEVFNATDPITPINILTANTYCNAKSIAVRGKYAYLTNLGTCGTHLIVYDISNPSSLVDVASTTITATGDLTVQGNYAFAAGNNRIEIFDIKDPLNPTVATSVTLSGAIGLAVQGKYLYAINSGTSYVTVIDISDPLSPSIVGSVLLPTTNPQGIAVQGAYAYVAGFLNNDVDIIKVTDPTSPTIASSTYYTDYPEGIAVSGRYVYITQSNGGLDVLDVSVPGSPVHLAATTTASTPKGIVISGRYAYISNTAANSLSIVDILGTETSGLVAANAELGSLRVDGSGWVSGNFSVNGALSAGIGGIYTDGAITAGSRTATSTFAFAVSTTNAEVSNRLTVGGKLVCLADGTNCTGGGGGSTTDLNWTYNGTGDYVSNATATTDIVLGAANTSTAGAAGYFDLSGGTAGTSTVYFGYSTNTNVVIGGSSTTVGFMNPAFSLNGNDLFVGGNIGSASSVYTNGEFVAGNGSTHYGNGYISSAEAHLVPVTISESFEGSTFPPSSDWTTGGDAVWARTTATSTDGIASASSSFINNNQSTYLEVQKTFPATSTYSFDWEVSSETNFDYLSFCLDNDACTSASGYTYRISGQTQWASVSGTVAAGTHTFRWLFSTDSSNLLFRNAGNVDNVSFNTSEDKFSFISSSTTLWNFEGDLTVKDVNVCLSDGTNCQTVSGSSGTSTADLNWTFSPTGNFVHNATATTDLVLGAANTSTAGAAAYFDLSGGTVGTSNVYFGYSTNTNVVIGGTSSSASFMDSAFSLNGNDLFVGGNIGSASSVYTNGELVVGSGPTHYGDGYVTTQSKESFEGSTFPPSGWTTGGNLPWGRITTTSTDGFASATSGPITDNQSSYLETQQAFSATTTYSFDWQVSSESGFDYLLFCLDNDACTRTAGYTSRISGLVSWTTVTGSVGPGAHTFRWMYAKDPSASSGLNAGFLDNVKFGGTAFTFTPSTFSVPSLASLGSVTSSFAGGLTVKGQAVCLQDGTNCSSASPDWTYNGAGDYLTTGTSTQNVLLGGSLSVNSPSNPLGVANLIPNGTGSVYGTAVQNKYLYAAGGTNFYAIDISNPALPVVVGTSTGFTDIEQIAVAGNYAYVGEHSSSYGFKVIDISDPAHPVNMGSVGLSRQVDQIRIKGTYAYVANYLDGMKVIDISDPASPTVVATLSGSYAYGLDIRGDYAYLALGVGGKHFEVVDISDPLNPTIVSTPTFSSVDTNHVYVDGRYAYVENWSDQLNIFDISSSTVPTLVVSKTGITGGSGQRKDIVVSGDYAYIVGNGKIAIVDVSDRTNPTLLTTTSTGGTTPMDITVSGKYAYVGTGSSGLYVIDLQGAKISTANIGNLSVDDQNINRDLTIGNRLMVGGNVAIGNDLTVRGQRVCTADGTGCLWTTNADGTLSPTLSGQTIDVTGHLDALPTSTTAFTTVRSVSTSNGTQRGIQIQGDLAFTAGAGRLIIYDISKPSSTSVISNTFFGGCSTCVPHMFKVDGNYVYIVQDNNAGATMFQAIDVSDPTNPYRVGDLSIAGGLQAIDVEGRYAYIVNNSTNKLYSVDISNPASMQVVSSTAVSSTPRDIRVRNGLAYVISQGSDVMETFDVSNPNNMRWVSSVHTDQYTGDAPGAWSMALQGHFAYVDNYTSGTIAVIDISSTSSPSVVGQVTTSQVFPDDIYASGRYVYAALYGNLSGHGIDIIDVSSSTRPVIANSFSNPYGYYTVTANGRYLYAINYGSTPFDVIDLGTGIETNGLIAHNAQIGQLGVNGDANVGGDIVVRGSATIGRGGLYTDGAFTAGSSVTSTFLNDIKTTKLLTVNGSGTSTFLGATSATRGEYSLGLTVGGVSVCLKDETNCPPRALYWTYNGASSTLETVTSTVDVKFGGDINNTLISNDTFSNVSTTIDGSPVKVQYQNSYVYVLTASNTLQIFHADLDGTVSSTSDTVVTSTSKGLGDMAVLGNHAYFTYGDRRAVMGVDITDPYHPTTSTVVGDTTDNSISARYVAAQGHYVYVLGSSALSIFDVSTSTFSLVGHLTGLDTNGDVTISGDRAYVTGFSTTLQIVDISDPTNPILAGTWSAPDSERGFDVQIQDDLAYILPGQGAGAYYILNVASSTNIVALGSAGTGYQSTYVRGSIAGRYLYTGDSAYCNGSGPRGALHVYDVASSTNPFEVLHDYPGGKDAVFDSSDYRVIDVDVNGRYAYVGLSDTGTGCKNDGTNSLVVVDVNGVDTNGLNAQSAQIGKLNVTGNAQFTKDFTIDGKRACLEDGTNCSSSDPNWFYNPYNDSLSNLRGSTVGVDGNFQNILQSDSTGTHLGGYTRGAFAGDDFRDMTAAGDYLYAMNYGTAQLQIFDVKNASSPALVNSLSLGSQPTHMTVQGGLAYIAEFAAADLRVVDLQNPYAPVTVSTSSVTGALSVAVQGKYAFVGTSLNGLYVFDISSPSGPLLVTTSTVLSSIHYTDMVVQGGYLYVSDDFNGNLDTIDIRDPKNPTLAHTTALGGSSGGKAISIAGSRVYVAETSSNSLAVYSISNPALPSLKGTASLNGAPTDVTVSGRYAYVSINQSGAKEVDVVDLNSDTSPTLITTVSTYAGNGAQSVAVSGRRLYIGTDETATVARIDIFTIGGTEVSSLTAHSAEVGTLQVDGQATFQNGISVNGGISVGGGISTLGSVGIGKSLTVAGDISNILQTSSTLTRLGNWTTGLDTGYDYRTVRVVGDFAYALSNGNHELDIFNVRDPANPTYVTSVNAGISPQKMRISAGYAYIADVSEGDLRIIDIRDPYAPQTVATTSVSGADSVEIKGHYAYVGQSIGSLYVFDVTDPALPSFVTSTNFSSSVRFKDMTTQGNYLYVGDNFYGQLLVVDISDPERPTLVSTKALYGTSGAEGLAVEGSHIYVIESGTHRFVSYDITDPTNPTTSTTGLITFAADPAGISLAGRYAYVTVHGSGVKEVDVIDVQDPSNPILISRNQTVGATPQSIFVKGRDLYVGNAEPRFEIYDIHGEEVNGLIAHSADLGQLQVDGDGYIQNDLAVNGALNVGGSIQATGGIGASKIKINDTFTHVYASTVYDGNAFSSPGQLVRGLKVSGRYLVYLTQSDGVLKIADVHDPTNPVVISSTACGVSPTSLAVQGTLVAADCNHYINIYDISDPSNPELLSSTANGTGALSYMQFHGRMLIGINTNVNKIYPINISDPKHPMAYTGLSPSSGTWSSMDVQGRYAYVSNGTGVLDIVDISDPENLKIVGTQFLIFPSNALVDHVQGRYAYMVNNSHNELVIVDISNSQSPHFATAVGIPNIYAAVPHGNLLFVGTNTNVMKIYDITQPLDPKLIKTTDETYGGISSLTDVDVDGRYVYVGISANSSDPSLSIYEMGGIEASAGQFSSLDTGAFSVRGDITSFGDISTIGSLTAQGAMFNDEVAIYGNASSSYGALRVVSNCGGTSSVNRRIAGFATSTVNLDDAVSIRCNGQLYADNGTIGSGGDYAEYFTSDQGAYGAGNVMALDPTSATSATLGDESLRKYTLGVISARPVVTGMGQLENDASATLVGLLGQLETKVDATTSSISIGDELMMGTDGSAVKAKGPGMVLGMAMEPLSSGTGTMMVYVSPHWWAGDLFISNETGSLLIGDLTNASTTVATSTVTTVDSPLFSFRGSAWDSASSSVITSQFNLYADMQSATTSYFAMTSNATDTNILTVSPLGDLAISGKLYPSDRGNLQYNKYIFYDGSSGLFGDYMRTNAAGWGTGSYDFAEMFPSSETLEPGDIVVLDPTLPQGVKKSTSAYEQNILGIVSTRPGFLAGNNATSSYPIALSGRVPTKVSDENGPVHAGDMLTPSSQPGIAMKATGPGPVVGVAMQDMQGTAVTSVIAYVHVEWNGASASGASSGSGSTGSTVIRKGFAKIFAGSQEVTVSFDTIQAYPMILATPVGQAGDWWISNQTDSGFTINLAAAENHDVLFSWTAEATPSGTVLTNSDNTYTEIDPTSGDPVAPPPPGSSTTTSSGSTGSTTSTTSTTP